MKKVAVLGSTGTLGKYITNSLIEEGYDVYPVIRKELDLRDNAAVVAWLTTINPEVVINCATAGGKLTVNDIIYDDVRNNLTVFLNFYNNSHLFGKFINVASGAEFDSSRHVRMARESDILNRYPERSYAFSKNVISRFVLEKDNFYNLRLFGCFTPDEPDFRLLKRCQLQETIEVENKYLDYVSCRDFFQVLKYYINNQPRYKDMNCVYQDKHDLVDILERFKRYHNLKTQIFISNNRGLDYTGDGSLLATLNLDLEGLDKGLKDYK
jgi:nucleoside-diphosphate-sugar epimerase